MARLVSLTHSMLAARIPGFDLYYACYLGHSEMAEAPQKKGISWKRGLFRFWAVASAIYAIGIVGYAYTEYTEIVAEFGYYTIRGVEGTLPNATWEFLSYGKIGDIDPKNLDYAFQWTAYPHLRTKNPDISFHVAQINSAIKSRSIQAIHIEFIDGKPSERITDFTRYGSLADIRAEARRRAKVALQTEFLSRSWEWLLAVVVPPVLFWWTGRLVAAIVSWCLRGFKLPS